MSHPLARPLVTIIRPLKRAGWALRFRWACLGEDINNINSLLHGANKWQTLWLLRRMAAQVGEDCDIESQLLVHNTRGDYHNLHIGERCHVGKECFFDLAEGIWLADGVTMSMRVIVLTHRNMGHSPHRAQRYPNHTAPVFIGAGAYIGAGSIILPGVRVGAGAVIAAGSVVLSDVPPYTMAAGVPAVAKKLLDTMELELCVS